MNRIIRIGSRKSKLALIQSTMVKELIDVLPGYSSEIVTVDTTGDRILDRSLPAIGDKGLFTRELEEQLLDGRVDLAVHSLKDLPTSLPPGLRLGAVTRREDVRDVFISTRYDSFHDLPEDARIATGSLRRRSQLQRMRPDIAIEDLRGNVPTRIEKLTRHGYDGIILAAAGVKRLKLEHVIRAYFDIEEMIPAAGQGALGIEVRDDARDLDPVLQRLHDPDSALETRAERTILHRLQGSCQVPIGVSARLSGEHIRMAAFVSSFDGSRFIEERRDGAASSADDLISDLLNALLSRGAADLIRDLRDSGGV